MTRIRPRLLIAALLATFAALPARGTDDPKLARQGYDFLRKHCYRCHGSRFDIPGYNVMDRDLLVAPSAGGKKRKKPYLVPGKPDEPLMWVRTGVK